MAEEESPEGEEPKKSSGLIGLIVMVVVSLSAVGAGLSLPFVVKQLSAKSATEEPEEGMAVPDPEEEVEFIPFDEITVNLNESRFSRFVVLGFSLQVAKSQREEIEKMVESKKLIFKNWIQIHIAEKRIEDLDGFGRNQVRRELQNLFNKELFDDGVERIQDVLMEKFQVQ